MKKILEGLYFFSIFLILIPSFSFPRLFPTVHNLGGYISIILFILVVLKSLKNASFLNNNLAKLFLIYFFAQSISILGAENLNSFLEVYKDLVFSAIFFFLSLYFIKDKSSLSKTVKIFFLVAFVDIITQTLIFLFPDLFLSFGRYFINNSLLTSIDFNLTRGRISIPSYDEILIPIILIYWSQKNRRIIMLPLFLSLLTFSFISNFRTRLIMAVFAIISSVIVFSKDIKKYLILVIIVPLLLYFLYSLNDYSIIDRFSLQYKVDSNSIIGRINRWESALNIGISSPLLGVGLGNYFDHLPSQMQTSYSPNPQVREEFNSAAYDPHNIFLQVFSETGAVGLLIFILILCVFIKGDFNLIKKENKFTKAFIISFWTLFMHSCFNPTTTITYPSLFWLLRVLIYKSESVTRYEK